MANDEYLTLRTGGGSATMMVVVPRVVSIQDVAIIACHHHFICPKAALQVPKDLNIAGIHFPRWYWMVDEFVASGALLGQEPAAPMSWLAIKEDNGRRWRVLLNGCYMHCKVLQ